MLHEARAVAEIGGFVEIRRNSVLANLDGLSSLVIVRSGLAIGENASLVGVDGLRHLLTVEGQLVVTQNTALEECCGFYPLLASNGSVATPFFNSNANGCNAADDILANGPCVVSVTPASWGLVKSAYRE